MRVEQHTAFDPQRPNLSLLTPVKDTAWYAYLDSMLDSLPPAAGVTFDFAAHSFADSLHFVDPTVGLDIDEMSEEFARPPDSTRRSFALDTGQHLLAIDATEDGVSLAIPFAADRFASEHIERLVFDRIPFAMLEPGYESPDVHNVRMRTTAAVIRNNADETYNLANHPEYITYRIRMQNSTDIQSVDYTFAQGQGLQLPASVNLDNGGDTQMHSPELNIVLGYGQNWSRELMQVVFDEYGASTIPASTREIEAAQIGMHIIQQFAAQGFQEQPQTM